MRWDLRHFFSAARPLLSRYQGEHSWFSWRQKDPESHIFDAWRVYKRANENALQSLLLGDAKIRTSRDLLMNFGLTSGNSISDERELQLVGELERQRRGLAGPGTGAPTPVIGPGSILNDQRWTPLLNDAFILGGVHGAQDFQWAEEGFERFSLVGTKDFLKRREGFGEAAPQYANALRRDAAYYKDRWKHYLQGHSNFWLGGLVRIFARELLGLKAFGYSPVYTSVGVVFTPGAAASGATFERYLNALASVNFSRNDAASINAALGEFLFEDSAALAGLSGGASPRPAGQHLLRPTGPKPRDWPR